MRMQKLFAAVVGATLVNVACSGESAQAGTANSASAAAPVAAEATGKVIEVKMITDGDGNYFEPLNVEARPGDVIRFVLVSGVHNVSFPSDQNAKAARLPGPSQFVQLPGQTIDVPISFGVGEYRFQCDPHAALGMVGTLEVSS